MRKRYARQLRLVGLTLLVVAAVAAVSSAATQGTDVRVTTHDIITTDPYFSATPPMDVLQQNEPSVAVHPDPHVIAVGVNDVRARRNLRTARGHSFAIPPRST